MEERSDLELLECIHNGDSEAMDNLLNKYRGLVKRESRTLFLIGADNEDLIQEGMIGLFKAVRDYSQEKKTSFYTFARLCIQRQMFTAVSASNRQKHAPLNFYISIDKPMNEQDGAEAVELMESWNSNPEQWILNKENYENFENKIKENLSKFERKVLAFYLDGQSYEEIAKKVGKTKKSVDNAVQRIRAKLG